MIDRTLRNRVVGTYLTPAVFALALGFAWSTQSLAQEGPYAYDDWTWTSYLTPVEYDVLSNDDAAPNSIDPDMLVISEPPANGTATVSAANTIDYTPNSNFSGTDAVEYMYRDDQGNLSNFGVLYIDVGEPMLPEAGDDYAYTPFNQSVFLYLLDNDVGYEAPLDTESVEIVYAPQGVVEVLGDGVVDYTPAAGFEGYDYFVYQVRDLLGHVSNLAYVDIYVDENQTPSLSIATIDESNGYWLVYGTVSDDQPVHNRSVVISGGVASGESVLVASDGSFEALLYLGPEATYVSATYADPYGRESEEFWTLSY
jgi:hypothetical protein